MKAQKRTPPKNEMEGLRRRVAELEAEQDRLKQLLADSPAVTYAAAPRGDYSATFISDNVEAKMGFKARSFINNPRFWVDRVHPDDRQRVLKKVKELLKEGRQVHEYRFRHKDGKYRWVRDDMHLIRDAKGRPVEIVGSLIDITERKQTEEAVVRSEQWNRFLFDAAPIGIGISDEAGKVIAANERMAEMMGYTQKELHQLNLARTYADPKQRKALLKILTENGIARDFEAELKRKDGTVYSALLNADMVEWGGRKLIFASARDVTANKLAKEVIKDSEQRFRDLFESAPLCIFEEDMTVWPPVILRANRLAEQTYGYSAGEMAGMMVQKLVASGQASHLGQVRKHTRPGEVVSMESLSRRRDGTIFPVRLIAAISPTFGLKRVIVMVEDTTEEKRSEQALRESEAGYRALVERIPAITYTAAWDELSTTTYISPQVEDFLGLTPDDYKADPDTWRKRLHPEDRKRVLAELDRAHETGQGFTSEYRMIARDGRVVWMHDDSSVVNNDQGEPLFLQGVMFDITETKLADENLRIKNSAIQSALSPITLANLDGNVTYVNPSFLSLWGYDSDTEILTKSAASLTSDPEQAAQTLKRLRKEGKLAGEMTAKKKDGSTFEVSFTANVVTDEGGQPICLMASFVDITERKRAEEDVRKSKDRLQHVIDNISDVLFELDPKGNFTFANQAAETITGYPLRKLLKMNIGGLIAPGDRELFFARLAEQIKGRPTSRTLVFEIVRCDNGRVTLELETTRTYRGAKPAGVEGIARDITQRVRAEEALRLARAKLAIAREEERRRLAGELHDSVGQGLVVMKLALGDAISDARKRFGEEHSDKIAGSLAHCDHLIGEVRRACRGLYPPTLESMGLGPALHQLSQDFDAHAQVKLTCRVSEDLGRFSRDVEIALFRIAQEAVTNAIRHADARLVRVGLSCKRGHAVLTVTDNGIGFDPAGAEGKGLGLTQMRERAVTLGGRLHITSRKGRTRITAVLPAELSLESGK